MRIFYGEKEVDYRVPDKYAFLNWHFDDGQGSNNKQRPQQPMFDNYEMGKAYLANALLTLRTILYSDNYCGIADSLIFPVLFCIWHSIELLLKSGISALLIMSQNHSNPSFGHKVLDLINEFEGSLKKTNLGKEALTDLQELTDLLSEFKKVNANFDFARYSFSSKGDFQFYNAPYMDDQQWQKNAIHQLQNTLNVPNTCVDMI